MMKSFLVRILRPTAIFAVLVLALMVTTSVAFAQASSTPYILTVSDLVCADEALTRSCITAPGKAVVLVQSGAVMAVYVGDQLAGYMLPPTVQQVADVPQTINVPSMPSIPTTTGFSAIITSMLRTTIWDRLMAIWSLGIVATMIFLIAIPAVLYFPVWEANIELGTKDEKDWKISYFMGTIEDRDATYYGTGIKMTVLAILLYLCIHPFSLVTKGLNWIAAMPWYASWLAVGLPWILGLLLIVFAKNGAEQIYFASSARQAVQPNSKKDYKKFPNLGAAKEWISDKMVTEGFTLVGSQGDAIEIDPTSKEAIVSVRKLQTVAQRDRSRLVGAFFFFWVILEFLFGNFINPEVFDIMLGISVYVWFREIWTELSKTPSLLFKALAGSIVFGGLWLALRYAGDIIKEARPGNILALLSYLPRSVAFVFYPVSRVFGQRLEDLGDATLDLGMGALIIIMALSQMFPAWLFG